MLEGLAFSEGQEIVIEDTNARKNRATYLLRHGKISVMPQDVLETCSLKNK